MKTLKQIIFLTALLVILLASTRGFAHTGHTESRTRLNIDRAVIYYNEACGMCAEYVKDELPQILEKYGITKFIKKDYINHKEYRREMNELFEEMNVPLELQSHIMTFVGDKYIIGGHVPEPIINDLFKDEDSQRFKRIVVYQDKMHGEIEDYKIWAMPTDADNFLGSIKTYKIDELPSNYLDYLDKNKNELLKQNKISGSQEKSLLALVLISGFLDGFNPCAFAVLIFFIAFLFTLQRSVGNIFKLGLVYISVIYLTYLGIGFGLFKALVITGQPHLMAKVGAWLVMILGLINLKDFIFPRLPIHLHIPRFSQKTLKYWLTKATLPAVIVAAFLVGLCTFPCSGGIYVAIVGLLASRGTFLQGLGYMLVYNLMFILPLLLLLALAGNKYTLGRVAEWQAKSDKGLKFWSGIIMIALGIIILIWFV